MGPVECGRVFSRIVRCSDVWPRVQRQEPRQTLREPTTSRRGCWAMIGMWWILWRLLSVLTVADMAETCCKCPKECLCVWEEGRKTVRCEAGGMTQIPTFHMDIDTQVLVIRAPSSNPNNFTIGRIFLEFHHLEAVHITESNVPAIGDSSFWPGKRLRVLDLGRNNISHLRDSDFYGLHNLRVLNLSDNNIAVTPSAPFRYLSNLTTLSLARNRLQTLVPRLFYMLPKLEHLDLSGNPLRDIDPENLKDVKPLRTLLLSNCQLTRLHSLIYQQLPNLEVLDLRDNRFQHFAPEEFRHLKRLRVLNLDGNYLVTLLEKTFDGHQLRRLGLARNHIASVSPCAFCNASIEDLDLSHNRLASVNTDVLRAVSPTLETLDCSFNSLGSNSVAAAVRPLYKLRRLSLAGMDLTELPVDTFANNRDLRVLNISHNRLTNVTQELFQPLKNLQELDLSANQFRGLDQGPLDQLNQLPNLIKIKLNDNPWSCEECFILPLLWWVKNASNYHRACHSAVQQAQVGQCITCSFPPSLLNREVYTLHEEDIEACMEPLPQSRILASGSQVGLIVALLIILFLVLVIIVAIILYRHRGAVYYTHEDERTEDRIYGHHPPGDANGDEKKHSFISTLDRIEETAEDRHHHHQHHRASGHHTNSIT